MLLKDRINASRLKLGLTQKELASKAAITQATISRLESGDLVQLQSKSLTRLAKSLNVSIDYLVGDSDKISNEIIIKIDPVAGALFDIYQKLDNDLRKTVLLHAKFLLENQQKRKPDNIPPSSKPKKA
jgi:transcriptional regulator with XRE-family HTH domain